MSMLKGAANGLASAISFGLIPLFTLPVLSGGMSMDSLICYRFSLAALFVAILMLIKKESFLGSREYVSEMVNIGVFGLSYHYYPLRWLAVGAKAAVTAGYIKTMDTFSYSESRFRPFSHSCVLAASVKFVYLNREWVRLYSEVSSGMGVTVSEKMVELNLVFNTVPFGVSVGKRFSGFAQIELGNVLCGMSIGVSYKF